MAQFINFYNELEMKSQYIEKGFSQISVNTVQTKQSETMKGGSTSKLTKMNKQEKDMSQRKKKKTLWQKRRTKPIPLTECLPHSKQSIKFTEWLILILEV